MYKIESYEEHALTMYKLSSEDERNWLTVCPERGGIITGFGVDNIEQLYLNKETLYDKTKNVRGGIPILFPISGQLEEGKYGWDQKEYTMPNHGVARINKWNVLETKVNAKQASITISLCSNEETLIAYPFKFEVLFTYILSGNTLVIEQSYRNESGHPMPIYAGFHPYFNTKSKTVSLRTDAMKYLDYNDDSIYDFTGAINMDGLKEAVVLLDQRKKSVEAELASGQRLLIETGQEFSYTMLWTEQDKDFVCIEPWMAKTDELNRKEELVMVAPKQSLKTELSITVLSQSND